MKKCSDCNVEMINDTSIHTDYVGGSSFEECIYLTVMYRPALRVKARVCTNCGKVELYVDVANPS